MSVAERNRTVARFRYKRLSRECKKKVRVDVFDFVVCAQRFKNERCATFSSMCAAF